MIKKAFIPKLIFVAFTFFASQLYASTPEANSKAGLQPSSNPSTVSGSRTAEELYKISPDDMVLGDKKAKVTVIEYASMTCSHCADFYKSTFPDVKEKYIDTGKIRFVFRPFPLDEPALRGAMLAYCSGPERFFKFIEVMFSTQPNWALAKNYLEVLSNIGKLGGLSGAEFDKCMADTALEKKIMQQKLDATNVLSVRATPTFFVNGNIYKGAHNLEYFSKILNEELGDTQKDKTATDSKPK